MTSVASHKNICAENDAVGLQLQHSEAVAGGTISLGLAWAAQQDPGSNNKTHNNQY